MNPVRFNKIPRYVEFVIVIVILSANALFINWSLNNRDERYKEEINKKGQITDVQYNDKFTKIYGFESSIQIINILMYDDGKNLCFMGTNIMPLSSYSFVNDSQIICIENRKTKTYPEIKEELFDTNRAIYLEYDDNLILFIMGNYGQVTATKLNK